MRNPSDLPPGCSQWDPAAPWNRPTREEEADMDAACRQAAEKGCPQCGNWKAAWMSPEWRDCEGVYSVFCDAPVYSTLHSIFQMKPINNSLGPRKSCGTLILSYAPPERDRDDER